MKGYMFSVDKNHTRFSFINDTEEKRDMLDRKWSHYAIFHKLINFMKSRGWHIEHDPGVHKIIRKDHWYGKKGDLEFVLSRYPRGFSFEFFQNIVFENPNGGRYDFDRLKKMPYQVKLLFLNETRHMKQFLSGLGIVNNTEPAYKLAADRVKKSFVNCWHHPQKSMDEFELNDLDGQTPEYSYNNTDRDKRQFIMAR